MARSEDNLDKPIPVPPPEALASPQEAQNLLDAYEDQTRRLARLYEQSPDYEELIALAVHRGDTDEAKTLIANGVELNATGRSFLPLIHEASGLGHTEIVEAMIESGRCDLTVRDSMGRLASEVAEQVARDTNLADRLAEEQAQQFRAKNKDPRRPDHPDYGNWRWED